MIDKENINIEDLIKELDSGDLFLRNRAGGKPYRPLNVYDVAIMLDLASTCDKAAKIIKRQQAEIEALTQNSITEKYPHCVLCGNGAILTKSLEEYDKLIDDISAEAIKEFAERLNAYIIELMGHLRNGYVLRILKKVDTLVKEMLGKEDEGEMKCKYCGTEPNNATAKKGLYVCCCYMLHLENGKYTQHYRDKCVICGAELPTDITQIVFATKKKGVESACMKHEFSSELKLYTKENGGIISVLEAIKDHQTEKGGTE